MIFTKKIAPRVMAGEVTRSTRLGRSRWKLNSIHPVQAGRYGPIIGHIRIVGESRIRLGNITDKDAQREGYHSLATLKRHLRRVYKGRLSQDLEVWNVQWVVYAKPPKLSQTTLFDSVKEESP